MGLIGDIVIGIIGAVLGGWLAGRFFGVPNAISGFNLTTFVVAFVGAALVLINHRECGYMRRLRVAVSCRGRGRNVAFTVRKFAD